MYQSVHVMRKALRLQEGGYKNVHLIVGCLWLITRKGMCYILRPFKLYSTDHKFRHYDSPIKATMGGPWSSSSQAFNHLVSFEQSHHKPMWLNASGPLSCHNTQNLDQEYLV